MIGIAGVIIEIMTPGFGIAGIMGGACLALYFAGHMIAGLTGWSSVLLFLAGVLLMILEVFIPGFGVAGISGILCFTAAIILMAPSFIIGVQSFLIALIGAVLLIALAIRLLGKSVYWDKLSLKQSLSSKEGYISQKEDFSVYIGRKGITITPLRPAGIVLLEDEKRLDVVSEGEYIEKGQQIIIAGADGPRVTAVKDSAVRVSDDSSQPFMSPAQISEETKKEGA